MATKDDRPGLLSKVAMFVRNPTRDWSDLERAEPESEAGYDKQALKEMIERKRQNDFIRKREFDHLRKLRSRVAISEGSAERPSVFQTSTTSETDVRAVTLKKIDEIEAQMSKQWWKGKQDTARTTGAAAAGAPAPKPVPEMGDDPPRPAGADSFAVTQPMDLSPGAAEFKATEMGAGMTPLMAHVPASGRSGKAVQDFSSSELFAIDEVDEPANDPELEEAAIRFANGDDEGAENALLQALRSDAALPDAALAWAAALLDLFRATNRRDRFNQTADEFALYFGAASPVWALASGGRDLDAALWASPASFDEQAMEALRAAMAAQPAPWRLSWDGLTHIAPDAMPLLADWFGSLCNEPVTLHFSGGIALMRALQAMTPTGDRSIPAVWWSARLNALRAMRMQDAFELAALDYCVTFEVSPPAWVDARCRYEADDHVAGSGAAAPATLELHGELLGDATELLAGVSPGHGELVTVACHRLVRVDFSAAGSILNWVATRQSEGCQIQFRDVHRLVAAFFNVIGINEHARVIPGSI